MLALCALERPEPCTIELCLGWNGVGVDSGNNHPSEIASLCPHLSSRDSSYICITLLYITIIMST
jgi:hypothetical protein